MARPGPRNDLTDIAGLSVGAAEDARVRTGASVILAERPMIAAVDVRGGGACTRETDVLNPGGLVPTIDALVLSGGSVYGLAAADAVTAALGAEGRGYALMTQPGVPASPIVPAACLYDLANGGDKAWGIEPPYRALGLAALADARAGRPVGLGARGAAHGARAGAFPGAIGSASLITADGITVAAWAAVNCFGSVTLPGQPDVYWAWPFEQQGEFGGCRPDPARPGFDPESWEAAKIDPARDLGLGGAAANTDPGRTQTTLAVVATDAALDRDGARRLAMMAQDGLARAIRPVHAPFDGDVVFALSSGARPLPAPDALSLARLGALAADTLARAIARGVHVARTQG